MLASCIRSTAKTPALIKPMFLRQLSNSCNCGTCVPPINPLADLNVTNKSSSKAETNPPPQVSNSPIIRVGIDVGSTTVKVVALDANDNPVFEQYQRHLADVRKTIVQVVTQALDSLQAKFKDPQMNLMVTGSGGLALSQWLSIPFIQEVIASTTAVKKYIPDTDVAIELGGEDAKITYFSKSVEQRMNGTCAGGTGAFIDQMAALLETDSQGLNELAKKAQIIYPIAARCGVFAKTDVQPLINEGARREDIAASIYQAVVSQTISGLACGKPIRGNVAFLGGPLHFLDQLRERFLKTLDLKDGHHYEPENSQLFVALGAALSAQKDAKLVTIPDLRHKLKSLDTAELHEVRRLDPLFANEAELQAFREKHEKEKVPICELKDAKGPLFLGIDAGSTTTKTVLIDSEGRILWRFYDVNGGNPVSLAVKVLKDLYSKLPPTAHIARACSTGYGETLFQSALGVDTGEVETIAHYRAAEYFLPGVEFLLDIGGQDMKCLHMKDGAITSIQLNEACSSGCGSFLDNFARSLGMDIRKFSKMALMAKNPVDLGNRCTVFMNSRVKQAQKEGASVGDISAGLSYSVIKNALFKVIKLRNADQLKDKKIVVQGGTFNNDAVLRAFEKIAGHDVVRPDIAGLMGAYGAALIARDQWRDKGSNPDDKSSLATMEQLENFKVSLELKRCGGCMNNCLLTINTFNDGGKDRKFVTGNRCERGLEVTNCAPPVKTVPPPNVFRDKYNRLFKYKALPKDKAPRGEVGIPRVLNMYENYPMWFTFFNKLGFRVRLSPRSSRHVYERGLESIPSESVCYPGKISHGHIESLIKAGVKFIWYPCAPYEIVEDKGAGNHYNCPIVTSYPEVLRNNIDDLRQDQGITYMNPFLPLDNKKRLTDRLIEEFSERFNIPPNEIAEAADAAWKEQEKFREDVKEMGRKALADIKKRGLKGIILAGRPYHLDPEINHGIPELITGLGLGVLTEDSVAHLGQIERPMRVVDQWTYHNRLYRSAQYVTKNPDLELVQMTSFGCGLDAVTSDQVEEILRSKGRMYTLIKVDEGSNLGAVRIRMRSLIAAMDERKRHKYVAQESPGSYHRTVFTEKHKDFTILAPQMSPIHFKLIREAFKVLNYNFEILPEVDSKAVDTGLQYVNNDACYPSIIVTGQMIAALKSGKYDLDKVALLITQTGGGCRATNYVGFIRRALNDNGWGKIPVIGVSVQSFEKNPGFKVTFGLLHRIMMGMCIGDVLMRVLYRTRPYELVPGSADEMYEKWNKRACEQLKSISLLGYNKLIRDIVHDFDNLPLRRIQKPRIGVVGEILVKFHPTANNDIVKTIEAEGAEAVVPDLADFIVYCLSQGQYKHKVLSSPWTASIISKALLAFAEMYRWQMKKSLSESRRFTAPRSVNVLQKEVDDIVQLGNITGEGWLLTAEMVELIHDKVPNIACVQPFACLPNHVTGKGMIKELRRRFPESNISAIDYDPGASEVNQLNRLKLLLANAQKGVHPDDTKISTVPHNKIEEIGSQPLKKIL
ncbi:CoA-substrate-specific enzyme activase [Tritrichomonas foetus]|uniref:N-acetyl-D-glucosamine kinase n=1 Tax=Tritrichomonas foetus TaxID=1144522 RepID=A0A1J4JSV1_9EUKA|nr:CoA-substrate-specific enzyme activase [Tritrichomonas foetus]|eukprot:OHT01512.1 CoA-substrate-specific enzyme activase [Tritrichomonas foetus]